MDSPSSPDRTGLERLRDHPQLAPVAAELLWQANRADDLPAYLAAAVPTIAAAVEGDYAALAAAGAGKWTAEAQTGEPRSLPVDLLADVSDRETAGVEGNWAAAPLAPRAGTAQALVAHCASASTPGRALATLAELVPIFDEGLRAAAGRQQNRRRICRLEAILEIANQWNQTREVEPLLVQMAEAATRLLGADRASIFLWDRRNHTLVGRPGG